MKTSQFYVGVTDNERVSFLAKHRPSEVKFWLPSGTPLTRLESGMLFLFKMHSTPNAIAGGGSFVRYLRLALSIAWDTFKNENGFPEYATFRRKILRNARVLMPGIPK